jgi:hypothetical protein
MDEDGIQIASLNMDKYISDIQAAKKTIANDCINFKISKKDKKDKKDKKNKEIEIEI